MSSISEAVASLRAMADDLETKDRVFSAKIDLGGASLKEAARELRSRLGAYCTISVEVQLHESHEAVEWQVYDSSAPSGSNFIKGRTLAETVKATLAAQDLRDKPNIETVRDVAEVLEPLPL